LWSQEDEEKVMEEAKSEVNEAIKKADGYPQMTIPSLIDSMFETLPASLIAQRAEYTGKEEA
jgi:pyruvate dehydrogenase E1 component alpha subunit